MNVLIVDDHEEIMAGIEKRVLHVFPDATCHFATKYRDANFIVRKKSIDLLLCDLEFKNDSENDGWHLLRKIRHVFPDIKAIAYTSHGSYNIMKKSMEAGYHSFLEKGCSLDDFKLTLRGVLKCGTFESPSIKRLKKNRYSIVEQKFKDTLQALYELSPRELQVALLASETTNSELIADSISTDENPVKSSSVETYIRRIMGKLTIHNRTDLVLFCAEFKTELQKCISNKIKPLS
jgi:DNA-binding NarL/FixJ family response regulator